MRDRTAASSVASTVPTGSPVAAASTAGSNVVPTTAAISSSAPGVVVEAAEPGGDDLADALGADDVGERARDRPAGRPSRRSRPISSRCCHSSTSRKTLPSVWRASSSTAARRSVPTAWPAAAGHEVLDPVDVEARQREAGDAGQPAQIGQRRPQRLAGVGRRRPVGGDDEDVAQRLVADQLDRGGRSSAGGPSGGRRARAAPVACGRARRAWRSPRRTVGPARRRGRRGRPARAGRGRRPAAAPAGPARARHRSETSVNRRRIDGGEELVERLGERLVRHGLVLRARAVEHRPATGVDVTGELREQPRLARSGLAGHEHDLAGTGRRRRPSAAPTRPTADADRRTGWHRRATAAGAAGWTARPACRQRAPTAGSYGGSQSCPSALPAGGRERPDLVMRPSGRRLYVRPTSTEWRRPMTTTETERALLDEGMLQRFDERAPGVRPGQRVLHRGLRGAARQRLLPRHGAQGARRGRAEPGRDQRACNGASPTWRRRPPSPSTCTTTSSGCAPTCTEPAIRPATGCCARPRRATSSPPGTASRATTSRCCCRRPRPSGSTAAGSSRATRSSAACRRSGRTSASTAWTRAIRPTRRSCTGSCTATRPATASSRRGTRWACGRRRPTTRSSTGRSSPTRRS